MNSPDQGLERNPHSPLAHFRAIICLQQPAVFMADSKYISRYATVLRSRTCYPTAISFCSYKYPENIL